MRFLTVGEISDDFLCSFQHDQRIRRRYVKTDGAWTLISGEEERRTWTEEKRRWIAEYLREQLANGGAVAAVYDGGDLLGFAAVDGILRGETARYANLTMLFVDDRAKRRGIGARLFREICGRAAAMGAERLFVSAIASEETVAFYLAMGCTDAEEYVEEFVDTERDRYLEKNLSEDFAVNFIDKSLREKILDGLNTPLSECLSEDEVEW